MRGAIATMVAIVALPTGCAGDAELPVASIEVVGCRPHPERGSGVFVQVDGVDEPLVLTSAHVVAGARGITVTHDGATGTGTIVAFDPRMDLAYLAVDGVDVDGATVADGSDVAEGAGGTAHVVRDGQPVVVPVVVQRRVQIRTEDVYVEDETLRPGFELSAAIEEGDSGGAVVVDGQVIGVVWARSRRSDDRAYAIDPTAAGELTGAQLASGDLGDVDLTRCP